MYPWNAEKLEEEMFPEIYLTNQRTFSDNTHSTVRYAILHQEDSNFNNDFK